MDELKPYELEVLLELFEMLDEIDSGDEDV
jgi:hypothetical protein